MAKTKNSYLSPKITLCPKPEKGGYGLLAGQAIPAGELLAVWGGRIITREELSQLGDILQRHSIQVEEDLFQVNDVEDELSDYVNHSCDPNAGLSGQIALVARRDIAAGEEICFDYAMSDGSPYDEFECHCGARNCRKIITGNDWKNPELWERYQGYFSPYLQRRIDRLNSK